MEVFFSWARDILAAIGGTSVLGIVGILYLWHKDPKNVELMLSQILRLLTFLGTSVKKWQIRFDLQSRIGRQIRDLEKHTGAYAPYDLSIRWVPERTERNSFLQGDSVIARMSYDENPHLNYLTAVLLFMKQGFIPHGRQFLTTPLRRAMDLAAINLILERAGNRPALNAFGEEVLPAELESDSAVRTSYLYFLDMEDFGLFGRLFLPEVSDYGFRQREVSPRCRHRDELSEFVLWLRDLASDTEYRTEAQLVFTGTSIRVAVIPVGIWGKIMDQGAQPYVNAVKYTRDNGAYTLYLVARGHSRKVISKVCATVEDMRLCTVEDTWDFRSRMPGSDDRIEATISRLNVIR